jgi:hypothetical protein
MTIDVEASIDEAIERVTTRAGGVLIAVLTLIGVLRAAAEQDIARSIGESVISALEDAAFREELTAEQLQTLENAEAELEATLADLPLALGLSPGQATALWLLAFLGSVVLNVLAIDTFGNARDTLDGIQTERLGRKTLHLFVGTVVYVLLVGLGFLVFILPGLVVAVLLVYFPVAVVLDDESFVGAFSTSVAVVRENVVPTVGIVLLALVAFLAMGFVSPILSGVLPAVAGAVTEELLSAVATAFVLALVTRAYLGARTE